MPAQGKRSTRKGLGTTRGTARTRPSEAGAQSASTSKPVSKITLNNTSAEQILEGLTAKQIQSLLEVVKQQGDRVGLLSSHSNRGDVQEIVSQD